LQAVNAGDLAAVPRRLNLWVKAGGRTLPGLVRRRAAEGALFAAAPAPAPKGRGLPVETQEAKPPLRSKTLWSAALAALAATGSALAAAFTLRGLVLLLAIIIIAAAGLIAWERWRKLKEEGL
jgi:lysozyme